ncbi:MAG: DUF3828 domain-containing protein [Bacteroidaceae bacterium]|nr:DUF3828 domain-containing protein [Bacteroidaceae bacterium]
MKKLTFIMIAMTAITFVACGNKTTGNNDNGDEDSVFMLDGPGSVYEPTEEEVGQYALETVQEVYEAVGQAYSSEDWQTQSNELDKKFCSKDWNATVKSVIEKDNQNPEEMGFFDADYWVMGQDFSKKIYATDLNLEKLLMDDTPWEAAVTLKLHNFSEIPVRVNLIYEGGEWKVDDLTDLSNDLDWKKSMKEYLAE